MAGMSIYEAQRHLNTRYRSAAVSAKLTNVYIALFNGDPAGTGVEIASTGGYARASVAVSDAAWTAPAADGSYQYIANVNAITYGTPTADWNGGNPVTHFGIMDASSGGNRLESGPLPTARIIQGGDNPAQFPAGSIHIRMSASG